MAAESLRADQDPAGEWIDDTYMPDPKGTTTSAEAYMRNTLMPWARRGNLLHAEHLTDSWRIGSGRRAPCVSTET